MMSLISPSPLNTNKWSTILSMDKMVDHLFVFNGEGEIKDIIGNYTTYRKYQHSSESSTSQSKIEATKALESQKIETLNNRKLSYM